MSASAVVKRWTNRLRIRLGLKADAEAAAQKAQRRYERARRKDLHPRARLRDAWERARGKVRLRRRQVRGARRVVNRHSRPAVPKLEPERTRISPNHSSRGGVKPRLIVLHITVSHNRPGLGDLDAILNFFSGNVGASSHIVNDREGHDARCVRDADKAWTQAAFNPQSLSIEQIEFEVKSRERWLKESRAQLDNTARWVAHWSKRYDIPLRESTVHGVCQHRDLGAAGGGHVDCSPDFPMDYVLNKAREFAR